MPYDPTLPVDHSPIAAAELRNQFNALKALIDAQATLNNAQAAQLALQATQIAALQALFPLPQPGISSDRNSSADGSVAKNTVVAEPEAWEFVSNTSSTPDPNEDISAWTSMGVLAGSDDGGAVWSRHFDITTYAPMTATRYQINGRWSLFSSPVLSQL